MTVAVYARASLGADERGSGPTSLEALQAATGEYASFPAYRGQFEALGFSRQAAAAARAHEQGRPADVPEDLVRAFCLLGDPEAARARVREFHAAGADLPVIYPVATGEDHSASVVATLEALAPTT